MKMYLPILFILALASTSQALPKSGLQVLFPLLQRQYTYELKTNISCGTLVPIESESHWTLEGTLLVQVYDNFTRVRYSLSHLKTSIFNKDQGYVGYKWIDATKFLSEPWEVEYQEDGNINCLYVKSGEPLWTTNMKRALSINFQLKKDVGTYYNFETCLYKSYKDCQVVYVANENTIRKFNALHILSENSGYTSWMSVPMDFSKAAFFGGPEAVYSGPGDYSGPLDNIGTADRVYDLDDKVGLINLDLRSVFEHKTRSHILAVTTELSLHYDKDTPLDDMEKLDLVKTSKRYEGHDYTDPTNGIRNYTQDELRKKTFEILLSIAIKGIDTDNIVRNASVIHNMDFVNLLKTMAQLNYEALNRLFEDLVLGTSYDLETARNIFLEVLPHVRTNACALFIKYLVIEQKQKIEDATILSLIRKLPFNVANHSQELLEQLEVFTRLGLDFSQEIRHAGILSFATLAYKAAEVRRVKQDYFDSIIVKYFRMYSDCPQYIDKLVWLQGISNIQYSIETYMWTIYNNASYNRHERFWAILATTPVFAPTGFAATWHILVNEKEHIQMRVAALHSFLSSKIRPSELLSIHNYIMNCDDDQLKRFWYTTVMSLENSKTYNGYSVASNYVPFLKNQVRNQGPKYWATGNHIVGTYDDETSTGAMFQIMGVGDPLSGQPALIHFRVKTVSELMATSDLGIFIKAEGVASNIFQKVHTINSNQLNVESLVDLLKRMKVQTISREKVHIEVVLKVHDKTVYVTHFNHTRFESWTGEDLSKTIEDFLKFGSHINQQMVYYPFQLDANIPTELGTPVRLQTAVVSFSSIRGKLTAPSSQDLTWKNDLHFRYQGTAVTSLSTDGPLLQSEHTARVQQSVVAHIPIIFDVSFEPATRILELKWPNPTIHNTGLAMHARAQVAMDSLSTKAVYTVHSGDAGITGDENSLFFDCEKPMTFPEIIQKLLLSNTAGYDFLTKTQPSVLMLNTLLLLSAPPSGSCGLVVGVNISRPVKTILKYGMQFRELSLAPDDKLRLNLGTNLFYGENRPKGDVYFNITGSMKFESMSGNMTVDLDMEGQQPWVKDVERKKWKFCLKQRDASHGPLDQNLKSSPPSYDGRLSMSYSDVNITEACPIHGSNFVLDYRGEPRDIGDEKLERYFEAKIWGNKWPKLKQFSSFASHPVFGQIVKNLAMDPFNVTAIIKESNSQATLTLNDGDDIRLESEYLPLLLDSWSVMQILKKYGVYRECRLHESTVHTLFGTLDRLPAVQCNESLALAECTDKPRFAVLRTKSGGIKMYTAGHYVLVTRAKDTYDVIINGEQVDCEESCVYPEDQDIVDFKITISGDTVKIHSRLSGVQVYHQIDETVILTPHFYLSTACGSCASQHNYKLC